MKKLILLLSVAALCDGCDGWSDTRTRYFPEEFMFGAATAAHHAEGGWDAHGKGENIWDRFAHTNPHATVDGSCADVTANSYQHYKEDVKLLRKLRAQFYKFSISWARVLPDGLTGNINQVGLKYYEDVIDELLKHKIQPMATLYHYDLPQYLQNLGGWTNSSIVQHFENYARVIFDHFGDKVKLWVTVNNPHAVCQEGYGTGSVAPGGGQAGVDEYFCAKNILLAHATVWKLYDKEYRKKSKGKIGISINMDFKEQLSNDTLQVQAAEEARQFYFGFYAHPIFTKTGDFPKQVKDIIASKSKSQGFLESRLPQLTTEEIQLIKGSSDFLGLSHFTTHIVYRNESLEDSFDGPGFADDLNVGLTAGPEWVQSATSTLRSVPFGLYKQLLWINHHYNYPEIIITELGWPSGPGLNDKDRIDCLRNYMDALLIGIEDGANVIGMAIWSLIDGFEWTEGYNSRFGLHEVDFESPQKTRQARKSALVYKEIIRSKWVDHNFEPKLVDKMKREIKEEL